MQDLKELSEIIAKIKQEIEAGVDTLADSKAVYEFKKTFLDSKSDKIFLLRKKMKNTPQVRSEN